MLDLNNHIAEVKVTTIFEAEIGAAVYTVHTDTGAVPIHTIGGFSIDLFRIPLIIANNILCNIIIDDIEIVSDEMVDLYVQFTKTISTSTGVVEDVTLTLSIHESDLVALRNHGTSPCTSNGSAIAIIGKKIFSFSLECGGVIIPE